MKLKKGGIVIVKNSDNTKSIVRIDNINKKTGLITGKHAGERVKLKDKNVVSVLETSNFSKN